MSFPFAGRFLRSESTRFGPAHKEFRIGTAGPTAGNIERVFLRVFQDGGRRRRRRRRRRRPTFFHQRGRDALQPHIKVSAAPVATFPAARLFRAAAESPPPCPNDKPSITLGSFFRGGADDGNSLEDAPSFPLPFGVSSPSDSNFPTPTHTPGAKPRTPFLPLDGALLASARVSLFGLMVLP